MMSANENVLYSSPCLRWWRCRWRIMYILVAAAYIAYGLASFRSDTPFFSAGLLSVFIPRPIPLLSTKSQGPAMMTEKLSYVGSYGEKESPGKTSPRSILLPINTTAQPAFNNRNAVVPPSILSPASSRTNQTLNYTSSPSPHADNSVNSKYVSSIRTEKCRLHEGKWVEDDSYPFYRPSTCPYVDKTFACSENGRPDSNYTRLRWRPHGCQVPRFNATYLLEKFRNKRFSYVGDSINRNQFESMVCMLREAVSNKSKVHEIGGSSIAKGTMEAIVMFEDYNLRLEFYRTNYLMMEEKVCIDNSFDCNRTLRLDQLDKMESKFRDADVIVFHTGHWWTLDRTSRGDNFFKEGGGVHPHLELGVAFRKAMQTWALWVHKYVDPKLARVFFVTDSPSHFRGGQWNSGGKCHAETQPIHNSSYLLPYPEKMTILEHVIRRENILVSLLNVTTLSDFRKDAHPSIYGFMSPSTKVQDCSHWCLPGLPDIWNELLYAHLVKPHSYI